MSMITFLYFCPKKGMSQGYRSEGGTKVKTPWEDPEASIKEVQNEKIKGF
jgi:hypothetical protein